VPVEVIGRDVQHHGHLGAEGVDVLELEARELARRSRRRRSIAPGQLGQRAADVAGDLDGSPPAASIAPISSVVVDLRCAGDADDARSSSSR
jgi:hypothetical protein